ncbi:MAG TPA: hypothetical protein VGN90_14845 [Pyrinomonadaceae bacterium]|nr:hypothetical protein [Pyrinomonadaceae bacterium]
MSIHNGATRLVVSMFVLLGVSAVVLPHFTDADPPLIVKLLVWPVYLLAPAIGKFLPHPNIGSAAHPVHEGTPLDFLAGLALVCFSIFLYPLATYVFLWLLSRVLKRKELETMSASQK